MRCSSNESAVSSEPRLRTGRRRGAGIVHHAAVVSAVVCSMATPGCGPSPTADPRTQETTDAGQGAETVAIDGVSEGGTDDGALAEDSPSAVDAAALVVLPGAFTAAGQPMRMLEDGDAIDLERPIQGGHVSFLGAQIKNTSATVATLRVRMRRPDTGFIVAEESRTVAMVPVPGEVDTMQPDLRSQSQVAQPPLCPDYDPIDIEGQPLDVEFEVTPLYVDPPRTGSTRLRLVPRCPATANEALCHCECAANYALGKCTPDARSPEETQ